MFKSFSSNISSNYTIAPQPTSSSGPWKIFDAKRKQTGKAVSVFVFDRKSLDAPGNGTGLGVRSSGSSLKKAQEEVLERLKKEASSLARLRHPSILELGEPVEETRSGGLMFVSEAIVSSLAGLLEEKDQQEKSGGRASRFVVEESDGTRRRRELEIDELEIQKGLLQLAKGLEFLHESAGLVHANLTPEAVLVNAKGDWKISGLSFCGPHDSSNTPTSIQGISLHEVLNLDPRIPWSVQLNIDYTSPDFVMDNTLTASADMFSLGLLIVALYNSPHSSPLSTGGSLTSYRRMFSSSSTVPNQSNNFLVPSNQQLPTKLKTELLPRLITRRPAQRLTAREFQDASYFDNLLVSTIRFLDELPGKTAHEKKTFMGGLPRIMPQFPKSVLERKVLPALLEEMKDKDLLASIMTNVFAMVKAMPTGKRAFTERVVPKLRELFLANRSAEKDGHKEAALMILLENMEVVTQNCNGKEFRDDILPIIGIALESPTHAIVDAALSTLPSVLPNLDFSTIKNELFPVIAQVFAKTSSLNIKIRGLEAFCTLCGGTQSDIGNGDDLDGIGVADKKTRMASSSIILDKYTVQEKVVPLLKGIKTKEPGVMMAALKVFRQVGQVADTDFLAMDVLPTLWSMSLGPLLNLNQFQAFMSLIKSVSGKIEREQTRKLQELSNGHSSTSAGSRIAARGTSGPSAGFSNALGNGEEVDFESLVSGRKNAQSNDLMNDLTTSATNPAMARSQSSANMSNSPTFSWQTSPPIARTPQPAMNPLRQSQTATRAITPDLAAFSALTPASQYSQPLQPNRSIGTSGPAIASAGSQPFGLPSGSNIDWTAAASRTLPKPAVANVSSGGGFSIPPPPVSPQSVSQGYGFPSATSNVPKQVQEQHQSLPPGAPKSGLDKYESLL